MYKVSPERERSPYRLQTAQDRPSKSPSRVYTEADRPRTPVESGNRSRDNSANRAKTGNYFFQPYSSPYVNGRKNDNFVHPSLASNPLFYDHNYGYKNDLPNDRLLTPVKHDKYRREDADHDTSYRGDRTPPRSPMQGNRRDTSEDNPLRNQSYSMKRIVTEENPRNALNRSVDIALRDREDVGPVRKNSAISQYDEFSRNKSSNNLGRNERFTTSPDNVREGGRLGGSNAGNRKQSDNQSMRDDMSEASTVMSTLSTTGYLCPKCMNKHMAGNKRAMCGFERELEKDQEARITNMHRKHFEEQEAKQKLEKAKRLEDTKEMKRILDEKHERRFEERRSPPKERDTSLHKVFDRQEEMKQKQMMLKQVFGTHIKNQIKAKEEEREKEKQANAQIHGTSLPIPGGYHNKYLDDPATVRAVIKDQVEEKFFNQMRERENEKRMAQDMHEQAMQQQQEEEQRRKMKDWAQKKEMRDAFARATNEKNRKQKAAELDKSAERMRVDQGYDDYKRRQMEKEEQTRKQLMGFKQYLLAQQDKMTYKQKYDERKQQKEGTSFDPAKRTKKKYPCGECNDPYEKIHLTKMH